jgi:hypothetical protein
VGFVSSREVPGKEKPVIKAEIIVIVASSRLQQAYFLFYMNEKVRPDESKKVKLSRYTPWWHMGGEEV